MKLSQHKRTLVIVLLCATAIGARQLVVAWPSLTRNPIGPPRTALAASVESKSDEVTAGHFNGHTEASIVARFGPPLHRWVGHYGAPPIDFQRVYPEAVTFVYETPKGMLYLSFCEQDGQRVCFSSHWMPTGSVF